MKNDNEKMEKWEISPNLTHTTTIEPRTHWWKVGALTTVPTLLPSELLFQRVVHSFKEALQAN